MYIDSTTHPSSTGNGSGHSNIEETTESKIKFPKLIHNEMSGLFCGIGTEIGSGDFPLTEDSQEGSGRGLF